MIIPLGQLLYDGEHGEVSSIIENRLLIDLLYSAIQRETFENRNILVGVILLCHLLSRVAGVCGAVIAYRLGS